MQPTVVAHRPSEQGAALIDIQTPLHFGVGVVAGAAGIDPGLAALAAVTAHMAIGAVREGPDRAMFKPAREAPGNQAMDILAAMLGVYAGRWLRMKQKAGRLAAPPATATAPLPAAGLGYYYGGRW